MASPAVPREMRVKRVMIAMACVGHGVDLGLESMSEMYDALCM